MRLIPNWRQLATNLDVDVNVIKRLGQYSDYSPTIRLFEFLEVTQPDLTIKQLKDALLEIRRNDLFSLLSTKGMLSRASSTRARVEGSINSFHDQMIALNYLVEGDRGAEVRENRRRERAGEGGRGRGAGGGRGRENRGREAGSLWGRGVEAEIKKAIVCCLSLGIIQSKTFI